MKIALCVQDEQLSEKLVPFQDSQREHWASFGSVDELCESSKEQGYEYIIVSDRMTDYERLADTLETLRERQRKAKLLMLLSNRHHSGINEQYMKLCLSNECAWVPPGRSVSAICDAVRRHIGDDEGASCSPLRKIVLFLGSTPNVGTTTLAFGTAWQLAATTQHKVGYLCLNLKSSKLHRYLGHDAPVRSLDVLRAELKSNTMAKSRLLQYCERMKDNPNLHVLYGNMLREQAEFFTAEEIEHLLSLASDAFDVCIVDVNAYWDNAATLCGVIKADTRLLVTTGDITHFQEDVNRWLGTLGNVFGVTPSSFDLILNQCDPTANGGIRARDIRKETGMHVMSEVKRLPELLTAANRGQLVEVIKNSKELSDGLSSICQTIVTLHHLQPRLYQRRRPWIKRVLSRAVTEVS